MQGDDNKLISSAFILSVLLKTNLFRRMFSSFESYLPWKHVSIRSFSKDEPAKEVKGNRYMYNCTQFNFKLGNKLLNEVEYDAKDYAN